MLKTSQACAALLALSPLPATAALPVLSTSERLALHHEQFLETRRESLSSRGDLFRGPAVAQVIEESAAPLRPSAYGWHHQISTTVFWVGEGPGGPSPGARTSSAWDPSWMETFGGVDDPLRRSGFLPRAFIPGQNPFYFALPYNDLDPAGRHRPEASEVIPWFWREFQGASLSVCKDRWIAIHHGERVCFAQWKDVGPGHDDDWRYVFQQERPKLNRNSKAGLQVSPAVRDFLALRDTDRVSWRFVEDNEVPEGPWLGWLDLSATGDALPTP